MPLSRHEISPFASTVSRDLICIITLIITLFSDDFHITIPI